MRLLALSLLTIVASAGGAVVWDESFTTDPQARQWRATGQSNLFRWNRTNEALEVTWDSRLENSFFYWPLPTILAATDDFAFQFDLLLHDLQIGIDPAKPYTFQIAVGLVRLADAKIYSRGSGVNAAHGPRNVVEFDYFADSGYGATVAPTIISTDNRIVFSSNHPLPLTTGTWFRVHLHYAAATRTLRTTMTREGAPFGLPPGQTLRDLVLEGGIDFRLDTFAVASYSDANQRPVQFSGSVLAQAWIDNVQLVLPDVAIIPPGRWDGNTWTVAFPSRLNWTYRLERSTDLQAWSDITGEVPGTGSDLVLRDGAAAAGLSFYRLCVGRP